jgi:Tol biopolymer transport system component
MVASPVFASADRLIRFLTFVVEQTLAGNSSHLKESDRTGAWQVWKQSIGGGAARQITSTEGMAPQESADGKWL